MTLRQLRRIHSAITYEGFEARIEDKDLVVEYSFLLSPDIPIRNKVIFTNVSVERFQRLYSKGIENALFQLGMGELMLMWRFACPQDIVVSSGPLSSKARQYWQTVFTKGFGEFYFREKIDFTPKDFIRVKSIGTKKSFELFMEQLEDRDLLLTTGGKDSAVTLDIMSRSGRTARPLLLDPVASALRACELAGADPIMVYRREDLKLPGLVQKGYFNGHTPYGIYLSLIGAVCGLLHDSAVVLSSNEVSANEINTVYRGMPINHQWAKSFLSENLFSAYCAEFISPSVRVLSFLRPLHELQICRLFAGMPQYHGSFVSCNVGVHTQTWCRQCPKCLSIFLTMYPFLGRRSDAVFGKDFLDNPVFLPMLKELLMLPGKMKPLECVATAEEVRVALTLCAERVRLDGLPVPKVLERLSSYASKDMSLLTRWNSEHNLPVAHEKILRSAVQEDLLKVSVERDGWRRSLLFRVFLTGKTAARKAAAGINK